MPIVITGANRGIGKALMEGYSTKGADVLGTARTAGPGLAPLEVTDPASHTALTTRLNGAPVPLLICNAGIYPDKGQPLETGFPPDMWAEAMAANVTGVFLTIQSLLPNLMAAEAPKIAIISSQMASDTRASGGSYIYRASKAAVLNLGRNLAIDLQDDGVAVGIYHPGWVQTDMGGAHATLTVAASAKGLMARFDALSMATSGCFESYDGTVMPF